MPTYCYFCHGCGDRSERQRPMRLSTEPVECRICGGVMQRDFHAELPVGQAFQAYESAAVGVPRCVIKNAFRIGNDWFVRDRGSSGGKRQINPPGCRLNPKTGDVMVSNRGEKRRMLRVTGLTDYGDAK